MRVFLSHASEQHADADRLAIALRARGHTVFLDRDDLPPGGDYQSRIEEGIGACDLFCFLISPQSVAPKRFTLSELGIARRRWPNPAGRVLPVMIGEVPIDSVPAYLRAVSILRPEGDFVADVLAGIDAVRPRQRWRSPMVWGPAAAAALVLLVAGGILLSPRLAGLRTAGSPAAASDAGAPAASAPATANLSIPALDRVRDTLGRFVAYMRGVGFHQADDTVTVNLYSKDSPLPGALADQSDTVNAFYYDHGIYVHFSMSSDMSVFLREYAHHILLQTGATSAGSSAIESALADYFPASFLGSPLIGEGLGRLFQLPTSYIRRLDHAGSYTDAPDEPHARGEVWAAALWSCRQTLGQAAIDRLPVEAWIAMAAPSAPQDHLEARFGARLAAAAAPAGPCLSQEIAQRRLPRTTR